MKDVTQSTTRGFYIFADDAASLGSPYTGTSGSISAEMSKAGGVAGSVSPTISKIKDGTFWVVPSVSHRDTLGQSAWFFSAAGALILPYYENVVAYDSQIVAFGSLRPVVNGRTLSVDENGRAEADARSWKGIGLADAFSKTTGSRQGAYIPSNPGVLGAGTTAVLESYIDFLKLFADTDITLASAVSQSVAALSQGSGSLSQSEIDQIVSAIRAVSALIPDAGAGLLTGYVNATWSQPLTGLPLMTGYDAVMFALKSSVDDTDANALLYVTEDDGLMTVMRQPVAQVAGIDASSASLAVDQHTPTGELTLEVASDVMQLLPHGTFHDGWKWKDSGGKTHVLRDGRTVIRPATVGAVE